MAIYMWREEKETFVVSQLGSYTNLYKSWHPIESITATWTFTLNSQQQFYLRIHTAQSETNWMWGWVFDKVDGANRWDLQLVVNNAWSTIHTGGQGEIGSSNTFSVTIGKESWSITLNGNTTQIEYTTTEKNRIATIFSSSTPYFLTSAYQVYWAISSWSNTITVTYS